MMIVGSSYGQRVKTSASFGGSYSSGNFNAYTINSQVSVSQDSTKIAWNLSPSFTYGRINRNGDWDDNQRESYLVGSMSYKRGRNRFLSFMEAENSYLKKIDLRGSFGLGYGIQVIDKKRTKLLISEALMYETYFSDVYINKNLNSLRPSTRIKFEYLNGVKITSILLFQPSLLTDQSIQFKDNINARLNSGIDYPIAKNLTLGLQLNAYLSTFSNYVESSVQPLDYNLLLVLKLKNF